MKFIELKKNLTANFYPCLYVYGQDGFLISNSQKTIYEGLKISYDDFNFIRVSNEDLKIQEILAMNNTLPFMCDKKLVVFHIMNKLSASDISAINKYAESPTPSTCFVIIDDIGFNIEKSIKNFEIVDCNRLDEQILKSWIASALKPTGKQIDIKACELLIQMCNSYLSKIDLELKKLVNFITDKTIITCEDIEKIVTKDFEFQIYELSDAVIKKDAIKTYSILNALKVNKDNSNVVISSLYSSFRRLFYIALNPQETNEELAKFLGCKEYAIKIGKNTVKNFSQKKLKTALEIISQAEFNIKSGESNKDFNNDFVVLKLLNL